MVWNTISIPVTSLEDKEGLVMGTQAAKHSHKHIETKVSKVSSL